MDSTRPARRAARTAATAVALAAVFGEQRAEALNAFRLVPADWDERLQQVVFEQNRMTAREFAQFVALSLPGDFDPDVMDAWLTENARILAEGINRATAEKVAAAARSGTPHLALGELFTALAAATAAAYAVQMVTTAANFGGNDAASKAGAKRKTWQVNSSNPRSTHAALDGETVPIGEAFSNGLMWPGDPSGDAEDTANCACSVLFD